MKQERKGINVLAGRSVTVEDVVESKPSTNTSTKTNPKKSINNIQIIVVRPDQICWLFMILIPI